MVPIREANLSGLEWRQTSAFQRHYELKSGDSVLAELTFLKTFGTLARMATLSGNWTFKRTGYLSPVVTARVENGEAELATYHPHFMGRKGALTLAGGEGLSFGAANFWASEWVLSDGEGRALLRMHNRGVLHHGAVLEFTPEGRQRQDAAMLAGLCWYVIVLHIEDSTVAASV